MGADRPGKPAYTKADMSVHNRACTPAGTGEQWSDPCSCNHARVKHGKALHSSIPVENAYGPASCSGRLLAGACLWPGCGCTAFANGGAR
jgi:hypothetical protein